MRLPGRSSPLRGGPTRANGTSSSGRHMPQGRRRQREKDVARANIIRAARRGPQASSSLPVCARIAAGERPEPMAINATSLVREALVGTGVDLVASCGVERYDACAPEPWRSPSWLLGARGVVVVASAGPTLWRRLRAHLDAERSRWSEPHPLDTFVAGILKRAEDSLSAANVPFRRFEPTLTATPRLDFLALGRLVGLGSPGPFGMLIHPDHGAWWALRGAWLVAADVESPLARRPPCSGCPAPCVRGLRARRPPAGDRRDSWPMCRRDVVAL